MSTDEVKDAVREADNAFVERAPNTVFPWEMQMPRGGTLRLCGLTKREYFAAMAMQGILSNVELTGTMTDAGSAYGMRPEQAAASFAVGHADALLAALEARHDG